MDDGFDRQEVRDEQSQSNAAEGGRTVGGAPGASDMGAGGGSSGSGGYGNAQNQQNQQGQPQDERRASEPGQSRGERYDEMAGGGRGADSVSFDRERDGDDFAEDQQEHQDRGQSEAEREV